MYFGMFGSIFLLTQFLQTVQGYSPLGAGLRMLAWTGVTMLVAPAAGILSDRIGGRPFMAAGLALQAVALGWLAVIVDADRLVLAPRAPFIIAGIGMGLFFAPVANVVLSAVRPEEEGQASGANNALRELGGVFGIAVLAAIFANSGRLLHGATNLHGRAHAGDLGRGRGRRDRCGRVPADPAYGGTGRRRRAMATGRRVPQGRHRASGRACPATPLSRGDA